MALPNRCSGSEFARRRRWASKWCVAGLPLLGLGCASLAPPADPEAAPPAPAHVARGVAEELPPPTGDAPAAAHPAEAAPGKVVPITLDTVLRLAEEQNGQIAIYRAKVAEACAERKAAESHWIPDIYVGTAYYRHEGGIQDFMGELIHSSYGSLFGGLEVDAKFDVREIAFTIVNAERKAWQQRGELSRITSETLLDAANTYIDLLAARAGIAISQGLKKKTEDLLDRARKLADPKVEPGLQVEVERIQAELNAQQFNITRLEDQAAAATSKLILLLGLDPCVTLVPVDASLVPIDLNDLGVPVCDLVERSLKTGPGIHEMEGLLAFIAESNERAQGLGRFVPVFEVRMAEGAFGAGPGANMAWDNRWDLGVQARWNLSDLAGLHPRREVTVARLQQLHLTYEELRRKLAVGVEQAHGAILAGRTAIHLSEEQIRHARRAQELSKERLDNNIPGSSSSEVLLSLQSLGQAQLNYLRSVREYDKDQLRLMILLGPGAGPAACPGSSAPATVSNPVEP